VAAAVLDVAACCIKVADAASARGDSAAADTACGDARALLDSMEGNEDSSTGERCTQLRAALSQLGC
jgi:hypothetical protein